jgi:hypothetical protein
MPQYAIIQSHPHRVTTVWYQTRAREREFAKKTLSQMDSLAQKHMHGVKFV